MKNEKFNLRNAVVVTFMTSAIMLTGVACSEDEDPIIENPIETVDIVETAIAGNPDEFNTLVQAVVAADLVGTLKGNGPFTVFAPTDAAFEKLTNILLYHVVPASVFSSDLSEGPVQTANGASIDISLDGGVRINDSNVIIANVQTTNGVIHVIDQVLIPAQ